MYHAVCEECGEDFVGETQPPLSKRIHQHMHPVAGRLCRIRSYGGELTLEWLRQFWRENRTGEGGAFKLVRYDSNHNRII